jgi:hypothetical protein
MSTFCAGSLVNANYYKLSSNSLIFSIIFDFAVARQFDLAKAEKMLRNVSIF